MLNFTCPSHVLEHRLLERGKTSGRSDDNLETIRLRFDTFQQESLPVIHFYESRFMLINISSVPPVDQVYNVAQKYFHRPSFEGETIIFVMGATGSGKSTHCGTLVQLGFAHICVSDIILQELSLKLNATSRFMEDLRLGNPIPTEIVLYLVERAMEKHRGCRGYLLDGFPFNLEQAEMVLYLLTP